MRWLATNGLVQNPIVRIEADYDVYIGVQVLQIRIYTRLSRNKIASCPSASDMISHFPFLDAEHANPSLNGLEWGWRANDRKRQY